MPDSELGKRILAENEALRKDVKNLGTKIEGLGGKIETVNNEGTHTRWITYGLTAVFAIVLGSWAYTEVNNRVDEVQNYQVASCEATNETRAMDRAFWGDVLQVIAPNGGTPNQKEFATKIQSKVDKRYSPRDCEAVKSGEQPTVPSVQPTNK